jgi:hypothetical protein
MKLYLNFSEADFLKGFQFFIVLLLGLKESE